MTSLSEENSGLMAEAKSKSKTVVCTLCDKPIATGKPVIIDDDPYHSDCAKAMEQSSGATEEAEEDDEAEEEDEETEGEDGEDESDEDEEDEEEDEEPAPTPAKKVVAKAPAKSAKRVVVEDEDDEDLEDEDDEEEEEVVVRPAAKKAAAPPAKKAAPVKRPVVVDDEDDEDEVDEEEEEVVVPAKKAVAKTATKATVTKRAAADYDEEDEPEDRPTKAKSNGVVKKTAAPKVDTSGWGNPAGDGTKRYFVYQALKEVTKDDLAVVDGKGKPENIVARAKRLHRDWAKAAKKTLSEKDQNYTSMNVGWIYNHADELGLVMRRNEEAGTYRVFKAKAADSD